MNLANIQIPLDSEEAERVRILQMRIDYFQFSHREGGISIEESQAQVKKAQGAIQGILAASEAHRMMTM